MAQRAIANIETSACTFSRVRVVPVKVLIDSGTRLEVRRIPTNKTKKKGGVGMQHTVGMHYTTRTSGLEH